MWIKGKEDRKGYFNLTHLESGVRKLLTATSTKDLQIRGSDYLLTTNPNVNREVVRYENFVVTIPV